MADFEIIEADFQQYYNLDLSALGFRRYARLLLQLPMQARFMQKYSPFKDWNWDREVQAQILHSIDTLATMYANSHRKKGAVALKAPPLIQPDYVEKAKKEAKGKKKEDLKEAQADLAEIFRKRNNNVKKIEEITNDA